MENSINTIYLELNNKLNNWHFFISRQEFEFLHGVHFLSCDLTKIKEEWDNMSIDKKVEKYNLINQLFRSN